MKILKLKIHRKNHKGGTRYTYPEGYDARKIVFGPIYQHNAKERFPGTDLQYIIFGVRDEDAAGFLKASFAKKVKGFQDEITEISQVEATRKLNKWYPPTKKIKDQKAVLDVLAKVSNNEPLTPDDYDIIDEDNPALGINIRKTLVEKLDEAIIKFS